MNTIRGVLIAAGFSAAASFAAAQGPGLREGPSETPEDFAARIMEFDLDEDGTLVPGEVDDRLHRLLDRADADEDGMVTRDELLGLATRELANNRGNAGGPGGPGGPFGGPGGGPGGMFGGPGGPGGPMMGSRPGEVVPGMLRQRLNLSPAQARELDALQRLVDQRLAEILSDEQRAMLQRPPGRGPGGGGPPNGGPRPGPGAPPPPF